jgi:XTP/dITP diphosphohydrolase
VPARAASIKLYLATSNPHKLEEVRSLASAFSPADAAPVASKGAGVEPSSPSRSERVPEPATANPSGAAPFAFKGAGFDLSSASPPPFSSTFNIVLLPDFSTLPPFDEIFPTFAENAAGKALHYSRFTDQFVVADDSGLIVPALAGAPGVHSARYAGPNATDADRIAKLLDAMRTHKDDARRAHFVCVIAAAQRGKMHAVVSAQVDGILLDRPQGAAGFGYDPIFFFPPLHKTFAEISREEKNLHSHRGQALRRLLAALLP